MYPIFTEISLCVRYELLIKTLGAPWHVHSLVCLFVCVRVCLKFVPKFACTNKVNIFSLPSTYLFTTCLSWVTLRSKRQMTVRFLCKCATPRSNSSHRVFFLRFYANEGFGQKYKIQRDYGLIFLYIYIFFWSNYNLKYILYPHDVYKNGYKFNRRVIWLW